MEFIKKKGLVLCNILIEVVVIKILTINILISEIDDGLYFLSIAVI